MSKDLNKIIIMAFFLLILLTLPAACRQEKFTLPHEPQSEETEVIDIIENDFPIMKQDDEMKEINSKAAYKSPNHYQLDNYKKISIPSFNYFDSVFYYRKLRHGQIGKNLDYIDLEVPDVLNIYGDDFINQLMLFPDFGSKAAFDCREITYDDTLSSGGEKPLSISSRNIKLKGEYRPYKNAPAEEREFIIPLIFSEYNREYRNDSVDFDIEDDEDNLQAYEHYFAFIEDYYLKSNAGKNSRGEFLDLDQKYSYERILRKNFAKMLYQKQTQEKDKLLSDEEMKKYKVYYNLPANADDERLLTKLLRDYYCQILKNQEAFSSFGYIDEKPCFLPNKAYDKDLRVSAVFERPREAVAISELLKSDFKVPMSYNKEMAATLSDFDEAAEAYIFKLSDFDFSAENNKENVAKDRFRKYLAGKLDRDDEDYYDCYDFLSSRSQNFWCNSSSRPVKFFSAAQETSVKETGEYTCLYFVPLYEGAVNRIIINGNSKAENAEDTFEFKGDLLIVIARAEKENDFTLRSSYGGKILYEIDLLKYLTDGDEFAEGKVKVKEKDSLAPQAYDIKVNHKAGHLQTAEYRFSDLFEIWPRQESAKVQEFEFLYPMPLNIPEILKAKLETTAELYANHYIDKYPQFILHDINFDCDDFKINDAYGYNVVRLTIEGEYFDSKGDEGKKHSVSLSFTNNYDIVKGHLFYHNASESFNFSAFDSKFKFDHFKMRADYNSWLYNCFDEQLQNDKNYIFADLKEDYLLIDEEMSDAAIRREIIFNILEDIEKDDQHFSYYGVENDKLFLYPERAAIRIKGSDYFLEMPDTSIPVDRLNDSDMILGYKKCRNLKVFTDRFKDQMKNKIGIFIKLPEADSAAISAENYAAILEMLDTTVIEPDYDIKFLANKEFSGEDFVQTDEFEFAQYLFISLNASSFGLAKWWKRPLNGYNRAWDLEESDSIYSACIFLADQNFQAEDRGSLTYLKYQIDDKDKLLNLNALLCPEIDEEDSEEKNNRDDFLLLDYADFFE